MKQEIEALVANTCKDVFGVDLVVELTRPDEQFGDYATSAALQIAKKLGKNPREVAEAIAHEIHVRGLTSHIQNVEVAGPGFINISLSDEGLTKQAEVALVTEPDNYTAKTVVIETNNPNPFKDLHIGHAYNSIVADTIANLLEAGQAKLHRVSYHGDVGLHVGKSMWAILRSLGNDPAQLDSIVAAERPAFLSRMYAEGVAAYEQDDLAKTQIEAYARQSFVLDDPVFERVYETCKAWSFGYFDEIFSRLGSQPVERRYLERETDATGRKIVEDHIGSVFERSDGAIIFRGEAHGLHTRVFISSRGTTLYEARDLGLIQLKAQEFSPVASYIVTAVEQKDYLKVVFQAAKLTLPELAGVTHSLPTGTVKLSSGKISSRKGTFINIGWLIAAISQALIERGGTTAATDDSIIGALRYQMLKVRIGSDVIVDISQAISLEGNSGSYLQYAHARARSILQKAEIKNQKAGLQNLEPGERCLVRKLGEYSDVINAAVQELMPHQICTYLYELAQAFNRFYEANRVLDDPRQDLRLRLVEMYAQTLKNGLGILGIPAPEKM